MKKPNKVLKKVAFGLVLGSFPVWFGLFLAPFLPLPVGQRALVGGGLALLGEVMFWGGGAILGTEALARFRTPNVTTGKSFSGKRVAVLGASGGLGSAVVRALQREGAEVVALVRERGRLAEALPELTVEAHTLDLTDFAGLESVATQVGALDLLVCATGQDIRKELAAHTTGELTEEIAVNLVGPMLLTRAFLPVLKEGGAIALLGGFADGRLGLPYYSADVASRAGVAAFCESMNRELTLEERDLRLCFICPAPADTEAERPYTELWRQLGAPLVAPERVANFVLGALLGRRPVAIMGWSNQLIAKVNALSPELADLLGLARVGGLLRGAFSRGAEQA